MQPRLLEKLRPHKKTIQLHNKIKDWSTLSFKKGDLGENQYIMKNIQGLSIRAGELNQTMQILASISLYIIICDGRNIMVIIFKKENHH